MLYESRCIGCHSLDSNRTGPAHRGVFGRLAAVVPGYDYSPALKASGLIWTKENLDLWLTDPEKLVPGQKMGYSVTDARDRSDLVAYLKSLGKDGPRDVHRGSDDGGRDAGILDYERGLVRKSGRAPIQFCVAADLIRAPAHAK
jgi:cytochrome c